MTQVRTDFGETRESARRLRAEQSLPFLTGTNVQQDLALIVTSRVERFVTTSPIGVIANDQWLGVSINSGTPTCALPISTTRNGIPLTFKDVGGFFAAHPLTFTVQG